MVNERQIVLLNLDYQEYLTYIGIVTTIGVSFFVAIWSYIFISQTSINLTTLALLGFLLVSGEIVIIAIYFWINHKKDKVKEEIINIKQIT